MGVLYIFLYTNSHSFGTLLEYIDIIYSVWIVHFKSILKTYIKQSKLNVGKVYFHFVLLLEMIFTIAFNVTKSLCTKFSQNDNTFFEMCIFFLY